MAAYVGSAPVACCSFISSRRARLAVCHASPLGGEGEGSRYRRAGGAGARSALMAA